MISRERLDEFKHKLDLIRESTAYYLKMSDQILREFDKKEFPLLISVIESIYNNKKLEISW